LTERKSVLDKISLNGIKAQAIIGTFPEERQKRQPVIADVEIFCDLSRAGRSDELNDTVDYFELEERIHNIIETSEFKLLERLAHVISVSVLGDPRIKFCRVTLTKPCALRYSDPVSITIERSSTEGL
jgi:FolB domain-containing protein